MNDIKNPLSPHLQIYRWHISSLLSITHRICGVINLLALILLYFVSSVFIAKSDVSKQEMYFSFWVESLSILSYIFLIIAALIF